MTEKEYKEKVLENLKDIKRLTDEYCVQENEYLCIFITPKQIEFNNDYWENNTAIKVTEFLEETE